MRGSSICIMAFITCTVPSGVVPGDSVGGRGRELFVVGGEGPKDVFKILLMVLVSKVEGYAVRVRLVCSRS
jgi:hypothetical protein